MKGPEPLLKNLGLTFHDPVRANREARLDSSYRAWIGYDAFYFASHDSREHFLRDPLRYCGALTDPVTLARFRPGAQSPSLDYGGRRYFFAAESTRASFADHPERWAVRGSPEDPRGMRPEMTPGH
ncbi:MAG: hypothetical protein HYR73_09810 [Candidatus Eisenbacteria bacterium]|nr:hypothetical protein [Candidatus Eisenbacteria bacterium]